MTVKKLFISGYIPIIKTIILKTVSSKYFGCKNNAKEKQCDVHGTKKDVNISSQYPRLFTQQNIMHIYCINYINKAEFFYISL